MFRSPISVQFIYQSRNFAKIYQFYPVLFIANHDFGVVSLVSLDLFYILEKRSAFVFGCPNVIFVLCLK